MTSSNAQTVASYLQALPEERRGPIAKLRQLIVKRLPAGFEECMAFGMISYVVPLARYPKTYNGQPLALASLASQKQYMSLYLMTVYGDPDRERWFAERLRRAGKQLNMGKSCVRFKALADLPLDVIGDVIARMSVEEYIAVYERARGITHDAAGGSGQRAVKKVASGKKRAAKKRAATKRATRAKA